MSARQAGLLAALAAIWGGSYLLIKYALEDFSAPFIVLGRCVLGAAVLLAVVRWRGAETWAALRRARERPWTALGLGAIAITIPFLLIAYGEHEVPSGLSAVLIASAPLFAAAYAPFLDPSETLNRRQGVGLVLGISGVALLVGVESVSSTGELLGALAMIGAAACYALSTYIVKGAYKGVPSVVVSSVSVGVGGLLVAPIALTALPTHAPGLRATASVVVLGIGATALGFVIFYRLIAELGTARANLVAYLAPGVALIYGALLLDEAITPASIGGLALILAGVFIASRRPRPQPVPEP